MVAGLTALFSLIPVFHIVIGIMMLREAAPSSPSEPPVAAFGAMMIAVASVLIVAGLTLAGCLFAAGRFLGARKRYNFCFVTAAVACVLMPFGTVLGVFTILVLTKSSVKALFEPTEAGASPA